MAEALTDTQKWAIELTRANKLERELGFAQRRADSLSQDMGEAAYQHRLKCNEVEHWECIAEKLGELGGEKCWVCAGTGLDLEQYAISHPDADEFELRSWGEQNRDILDECAVDNCHRGWDLGEVKVR